MNQAQLDRIEQKLDLLLERTEPKAKAKRTLSEVDLVEFEQFWKAYPRKVGKTTAVSAWRNRKAQNTTASLSVILRDIKIRMQNDDRWVNGYIPNPSTYINQCRWQDQVIAPRKPKVEIPRDDEGILRAAREMGARDPRPGESYYDYRKHLLSRLEK